jgi:Zn-dependent protease
MDPEFPPMPPSRPQQPLPAPAPDYHYPYGYPQYQQYPQPVPFYTPIASGAFPEVLEAIDRQQRKQTGWVSGSLILLVSLGVFVGLGVKAWSWGFVLLLLPVLLFHELGHFAAMKLFGYRNLRMFFIPFLGAAVSGRNYNVAGWKKVIVFLMGPVPGILAGSALGICAMLLHQDMLVKVSLIALLLNAFNLLPVLPLDGGWIAHTIVFSRHWLADVLFRAAAAGALLLVGVFSHDRWVIVIAVFMLLGLPVSIKVAQVVRDLRREGFMPASPDDQTIPPYAAEVIVAKLKSVMPANVSPKVLAQQTLQVFESLNARPPGVGASFAFVAVHVGSFLLALLVAALVYVNTHPGMFDRARSRPGSGEDQVRSVVPNPLCCPNYAFMNDVESVTDCIRIKAVFERPPCPPRISGTQACGRGRRPVADGRSPVRPI